MFHRGLNSFPRCFHRLILNQSLLGDQFLKANADTETPVISNLGVNGKTR